MELTQIPKIELHLHLDGAVPPETMWRMAQEKGLALPADTLEDFRTSGKWHKYPFNPQSSRLQKCITYSTSARKFSCF